MEGELAEIRDPIKYGRALIEGGVWTDLALADSLEYKGDTGASIASTSAQIRSNTPADEARAELTRVGIEASTVGALVTLIKVSILRDAGLGGNNIASGMATLQKESEKRTREWVQSVLDSIKQPEDTTRLLKLDELDTRMTVLEEKINEIQTMIRDRSTVEMELFEEAKNIVRDGRKDDEMSDRASSTVARLELRAKDLETQLDRLKDTLPAKQQATTGPEPTEKRIRRTF